MPTKIEWTDETWNPITGCTLVSEGCRNCYAAQLAATRLKHHPSRKGMAKINADGVAKFTGEVRFNAQWLTQPLKWKRPRMIFVCAHGDLFHENVPDEWIDQVFAVMALCPHHTFQVLTKRPERMREYITGDRELYVGAEMAQLIPDGLDIHKFVDVFGDLEDPNIMAKNWPLPNVWLGTSVEDQATADQRIPLLLQTPAAIRFISAEPLLGAVDLRSIDISNDLEVLPLGAGWLDLTVQSDEKHPKLDWVILGGESGKHARPMHPDWARSLRDQCADAQVPFFFKQWGAWKAVSQMQDNELTSIYSSKINTPSHTLFADGTVVPNLYCDKTRTDHSHMQMFRIGKKATGDLLDGVQHHAMPVVL